MDGITLQDNICSHLLQKISELGKDKFIEQAVYSFDKEMKNGVSLLQHVTPRVMFVKKDFEDYLQDYLILTLLQVEIGWVDFSLFSFRFIYSDIIPQVSKMLNTNKPSQLETISNVLWMYSLLKNTPFESYEINLSQLLKIYKENL